MYANGKNYIMNRTKRSEEKNIYEEDRYAEPHQEYHEEISESHYSEKKIFYKQACEESASIEILHSKNAIEAHSDLEKSNKWYQEELHRMRIS